VDAARIAALQDARAAELERRVRRFVPLAGDEHVLDVGTGAGALALAVARHVQDVVGVDPDVGLLAEARARAVENVTFVEGDATELPFDDASFDLVATLRTLHHVRRPELAFAELTRVTRAGGRLLVVDQLAPADPLRALDVDRFERAREDTHVRLLPDQDVRHFFEANDLVLVRFEVVLEDRPLGAYLDLAGCTGDSRRRAIELAPSDPYHVEIGWYLAAKPKSQLG
jgi:SAM-dependent methyltransferase